MKKSILVAAMALATFGANAASTTTAELSAPQIYGKVGVSANYVNENTELDYLSNTEVGVKGQAGVAHNIKATYAVEGEFNNDEKFELSKLEVGVDYDMFSARMGKMDSRFDMVSNDFDVFGDTFSGTSFDRDDSTVTGVALSVNPITDLEVGLQVSGQESDVELGDNLAVFANYTINNLDLSAGYEFDAKNADKGRAVDTQKASVAAGYTLGDANVSAFFNTAKADKKDAENTFGVQGAYRVTDAATLKAGYERADSTETNTYRIAAQYDLSDNFELNAGYGYSKADTKGAKSDDLVTVGAVYTF